MSPPKPSTITTNNTRKLTTNQRPSPLTINRESQTITKLRREPVIIYTHSPKIIHTQARDFMALVQRLTGLSRESVLSDDSKLTSSAKEADRTRHHMLGSSDGSCFADMPLFTPNGKDLNMFCSPKAVGSSSLSPSILEFVKGLSDY